MVFIGSNGVGKTSIIKLLKGNSNINNLAHTKKTCKEELTYTQNGHKIIVELKDTNGDECKNETFTKAIDECKVFFLVFNIYKLETLYKLEDWLKQIDINNNKVYLLGYTSQNNEEKMANFIIVERWKNFHLNIDANLKLLQMKIYIK